MLRLVPILPLSFINLSMGAPVLRNWTFHRVRQVGKPVGMLVDVNAGSQLSRIAALCGIVSTGVLGAVVLPGMFPSLRWRTSGCS